MSYQKKSIILQQLQQAIRKKAQQKSRNKDQVNRAIQGSIQKKKNVLKTTTNMNKQARLASIHKNSQTASKQNLAQKPVSIFNNDHLTVFETSQFKAKKYNNRRLDKLVSLIQYVISSSEKALRYISSNNFEAEFALKLYRSDRENLVNQIKNLNFDDIIDSHRHFEKTDYPKQDHNFNILLEENNKLKKQILILEKQAQSYHNKIKDGESFEIKHLQKQNIKLKQTLRKLIPFQGFKQIIQLLQKQNKFQIMLTKCQQNSKKTTQIQIVIASIENERTFIVQSLSKMKEGKSQRSYKLSQIQGEKEQLQKQLAQMKVKISEIIDSGKSISQLQLIKKNSQLVTEKLMSVIKEISPHTLVKKSSEQLLESIKNICLSLKSKNSQLSSTLTSISQINQDLKKQIHQLRQQKQQLQNQIKTQQQEIRMHNMLSQIQKLRDIVDDFSQNQQASNEKIEQLQQQLTLREERISKLIFQLEKEKEGASKMKNMVDQVNLEMEQVVQKYEEREHYYKDKAMKIQQKNRHLQEQMEEVQQQNEQLKSNLDQALRRNQSRQDSKLLFTQKMKIDYQNQYQLLQKQQQNLQKELESKDKLIIDLQHQNKEIKNDCNQIQLKLDEKQAKIKELQAKIVKASQGQIAYKKEINAFQKNQSELKVKISQFNKNMQIIQSQKQELTAKLRIAQNSLVQTNSEKDQNHFLQDQKQTLFKKIQAANSKIAFLQQQVQQNEDQFQQKQAIIEQLQQRITKEIAQHKKTQQKQSQTSKQNNIIKQQLQFLKKQKDSLQKLIQQQRQKHNNQLLTNNTKLQQFQLITLQLKQEKAQLGEKVNVYRQEVEALNQKVNIMQEEIRQLEDQIKSLNLLSNQALSERQHSRELISHIQDQRQSLKNELNSTKQKLQDHSQIVRFKNKQYVNLLKQILKGLHLDPLDYADKTTFQELLEFGSQQVVQLRKKQREQESNKRKNDKKEFDNSVNQFNEQNLEQCKAQLFSNNQIYQNASGLFNRHVNYYQEVEETNTKDILEHNQEKLDINDFGQLKDQVNNSMISQEENVVKTDLEQFNDLQSQKMNDSMISNDLNQEKVQFDKMLVETKNEKYQFENNLSSQFKEIHKSKNSQDYSQNNDQIKSKNMSQSEGQSVEIDDYNINNNKSQQNGSIGNHMQNNSMIFQMNAIGSPKKQINLQVPKRQYSKFTDRSIAIRNQQLDLDQFEEVKSVQDNQSVVSNNDFGQNHGEIVKEDQDLMNQSDVKLYPLRLEETDKDKQVNLQQFKQLDGEAMSQSMLSQKQENVNIDQFGDLGQSGLGLGQSMMSVKQEQRLSINSSHGKKEHAQDLGIDQFGQVQQQMNNSMLSNKNSQHGLSEFGELAEQKLNDSVLSKQEKQHGMSQFGEIEQNHMNDSILSANLNQVITQSGANQGENFDQFDEYKSQKMSESMISQNQGISPRRQFE